MPNVKRSFSWKLVVALLAAFLLGGAIWPAYQLGSDMYAEYQFGKTYQDDIRYRVTEAIEAEGQDIFVIGVHEDTEYKYAVVWVSIVSELLPEFSSRSEAVLYVYQRLADAAVTLAAYYPQAETVHVFVAAVRAYEGYNATAYVPIAFDQLSFDMEAVDAIVNMDCDDCIAALFNQLAEEEHYVYTPLAMFGGMPMNAIAGLTVLDRGPDYIYPWE